MNKTIQQNIKQQIDDVSFDFTNLLSYKENESRLTADEREELLNYWIYLKEVTKSLNKK